MKQKLLITLALTAAMVAACSKSDTPDGSNPGATPISFQTEDNWGNVVATTQTRGEQITTAQNFVVFATYYADGAADNGQQFMNNQLVEKDGDVWKYSPIKYWSNNPADTYNFYAYSPAKTSTNGITNSVIEDGVLNIDYAMPTICANQPDLLVATPQIDFKPTAGGGITMTFNHVLSAIGFMIKGDTTMQLLSLSIEDLPSTAELTHTGTSCEWTTPTAVKDFDVNITQKTAEADATLVTASDGYILAIPQTPPSGTTVDITYRSLGDEDTILAETLHFPADTEWEASHQYLYTIILEETIRLVKSDWDEIISDDTITITDENGYIIGGYEDIIVPDDTITPEDETGMITPDYETPSEDSSDTITPEDETGMITPDYDETHNPSDTITE